MRWNRSTQRSSPSLVLGIFRLAMHENRLKTTNSFVSEATIQQMPSLPYRPSPLSKEYQDEQPSSGSKAKNYLQKTKNVSLQLLKKYWFLLGLAIAIILATQVPDVARKDGYIHAEWSIKWGESKNYFFSRKE